MEKHRTAAAFASPVVFLAVAGQISMVSPRQSG